MADDLQSIKLASRDQVRSAYNANRFCLSELSLVHLWHISEAPIAFPFEDRSALKLPEDATEPFVTRDAADCTKNGEIVAA